MVKRPRVNIPLESSSSTPNLENHQSSHSNNTKSHIESILDRIREVSKEQNETSANQDPEGTEASSHGNVFDDDHNENIDQNVVLQGAGSNNNSMDNEPAIAGTSNEDFIRNASVGIVKVFKVGNVKLTLYRKSIKKRFSPDIEETLFSIGIEVDQKPSKTVLISKVERALFRVIGHVISTMKTFYKD